MQEHAGASFATMVAQAIDNSKPITVFLVDDDVFIEPVPDVQALARSFENDEVIAHSLRLAPNVTYCFNLDLNTPPPALRDDDSFAWEGMAGDWGYPMSLDGHLFRTQDILSVLSKGAFTGPNTLEDALMAGRPTGRSRMVVGRNQRLINTPLNRVQKDFPNKMGDVPAWCLDVEYALGRRLDHFVLTGQRFNAVHVPVTPKFIDGGGCPGKLCAGVRWIKASLYFRVGFLR